MSPKITIENIAREANVSIATVSRVLNNSSSVTERTKERVNKVIQDMNYTPSAVARNLSKQKTTTIGVIIPQIDNPFFGHALRGISEVVDKNGYAIMCFNMDDHYIKDIAALNRMKEYRIAGLLFTPAVSYDTKAQRSNIIAHLNALDSPIVCFDRRILELNLDEVVFDDEYAVYEAVTRMIVAGHTRIGLINGARDSYLGRIRLNGYVRALQDANLPVQEKYMFFGNLRSELGYKQAKELLNMADRPTCVMLCNNEISYGFLCALRESGLKLVRDIQCVGLDRIDLLDIMDAGFNYIERDGELLGRTAAELLVKRIKSPERPREQICLLPKIATPYL